MVWASPRETKTGHRIEVERRDGTTHIITGKYYLWDRDPVTKKQVYLGVCAATTKHQADREALLLESDKIRGTLKLPGTGPTLKEGIDKFLDQLEENNKRQSTLDLLKRCLGTLLEHFGATRRLIEISKNDLLDFRSWLKKREFKRGKQTCTHSVNGRRIILNHIRWFFAYCETRYEFLSPAKKLLEGLEKVEIWRALEDKEIAHLYQTNFHNFGGFEGMGDSHWKARVQLWEIIMVALHSGMRQGEIVSADAKNYRRVEVPTTDPQTHQPGFVTVGQLYLGTNTKTGERRYAVIPPPIMYIYDRVKEGPIHPDWSQRRLRKIWCKLVKRANMGRVRFHDLRHTCASNAFRKMRNTNLKEVGQVLGHRSESSTNIYTHLHFNDVAGKLSSVRYDAPELYGSAPIVASIVAGCGKQEAILGNNGHDADVLEIHALRR